MYRVLRNAVPADLDFHTVHTGTPDHSGNLIDDFLVRLSWETLWKSGPCFFDDRTQGQQRIVNLVGMGTGIEQDVELFVIVHVVGYHPASNGQLPPGRETLERRVARL